MSSWAKLGNPELRALLAAFGQPTEGDKAALLRRLQSASLAEHVAAGAAAGAAGGGAAAAAPGARVRRRLEGDDDGGASAKRRRVEPPGNTPAAAAAAPAQPSPRSPSLCAEQRRAEEFLRTLGIHEGYLDRQHDRCYCIDCYPARYPDTIRNQGPTPYVVPRGWVRVGLADPRLLDPDLKVFDEWSVSFHGVRSAEVLKSILQERRMIIPGEKLLDGTTLKSARSAGRQNDGVIYTSQTVKYAGLKFYACPQTFRGGEMAASIVLQLRQNPRSIDAKQGETMGFERGRLGKGPWPGHLGQECPHVDLKTIEWKSSASGGAIPYGLLIRTYKHCSADGCRCDPGYASPLDVGARQPQHTQTETPRQPAPRGAQPARISRGMRCTAAHPREPHIVLRRNGRLSAACDGAIVTNGETVNVRSLSADGQLARVRAEGAHVGQVGWLRVAYLSPVHAQVAPAAAGDAAAAAADVVGRDPVEAPRLVHSLGEYSVCPANGKCAPAPVSTDGGAPTKVTFTSTAQERLQLCFLDSSAVLHPLAYIAPRGKVRQRTFVGHTFVLRRSGFGGETIAWYRPTRTPTLQGAQHGVTIFRHGPAQDAWRLVISTMPD